MLSRVAAPADSQRKIKLTGLPTYDMLASRNNAKTYGYVPSYIPEDDLQTLDMRVATDVQTEHFDKVRIAVDLAYLDP